MLALKFYLTFWRIREVITINIFNNNVARYREEWIWIINFLELLRIHASLLYIVWSQVLLETGFLESTQTLNLGLDFNFQRFELEFALGF